MHYALYIDICDINECDLVIESNIITAYTNIPV